MIVLLSRLAIGNIEIFLTRNAFNAWILFNKMYFEAEKETAETVGFSR